MVDHSGVNLLAAAAGAILIEAPETESDPVAELVVPAILLRSAALGTEIVQVYRPSGPVVAFSQRDVRAVGFAAAVEVARAHGFAAVVRSPGGRMVAYDEGAVIVDHVTRPSGQGPLELLPDLLAVSARQQTEALSRLGVTGARVGEVDGEYCPGEFSVNIDGTVKVIGSAQRVTRPGVLVSSVVQVRVSERVRSALVAVSSALGYPLEESTIGGLTDFAPDLATDDVAAALADDYRTRVGLIDAPLPAWVAGLAGRASLEAEPGRAFHVDDWVRKALAQVG